MSVDFRVNVALYQHPKFLRLVAECGPEGGICLHKLWAFAAASRPNGSLTGLQENDIEIAAGWTGKSGVLVDAFLKLKWLTRTRGRVFEIHGWQEHQPWLTGHVTRREHARRAARSRWMKDDIEGDVDAKGPVNAEESTWSEHCSEQSSEHARGMPGAMPLSSPKRSDLRSEDLRSNHRSSIDPTIAQLKLRDIGDGDGQDAQPRSADQPSQPAPSPKRRSKKRESEPPGFQRFWAVYPRQRDRKRACDTWRALDPNPETDPILLEQILAAVERSKRTEWVGKDPEHIPYAKSYLNGERWKDEPDHVIANTTSRNGGPPDPERPESVVISAAAARRDFEKQQHKGAK
jgi:hypothetical protein